MSKRTDRPWLNILLGLLCIAAIVVAYTTVGQASPQSGAGSRVVTAASGVVQSTVAASGNIQAATQLNLGFRTSGVVTHIYVTQGQHVIAGQLLATLNPQSSEVTFEQAKASLKSAEANLAQEEESNGETSTGQSSANTSTAKSSVAATASLRHAPAATAAAGQTTTPSTTTPSPRTTSPTRTTPASKTTATSKGGSGSGGSSSSSASGGGEGSGSSSSKSTISSATREANLASAKAAVRTDKLTVQSDEQAVQDTKLYAPQDGTIVSLSGEVGESVSAKGTTKASSSSGSSSSGGSNTGAAGGSSAQSGRSSSSSGSSSSSSTASSSSPFAVLSDLSSMELVVPFSESEVGNVRDAQTATVTIEALGSRKLAAHVISVATLSTTSSGVVSYDVAFQLDQSAGGLKPGMSASAEVVVKQAEGVNVPSTAISGGTVAVLRGGKQVRQAVSTGLAGNSSTIILSGLKAGEQIALPLASTSTSSSSLAGGKGSRSVGGGRLGGANFPVGAFGGGPPGAGP